MIDAFIVVIALDKDFSRSARLTAASAAGTMNHRKEWDSSR